ncbi:MAG: NADH-quinone oxidoreductase subunit L [Bacillota bacterium]|nr:NADH-quinone oxidoreductase subunit L [Bacillota bacterium]
MGGIPAQLGREFWQALAWPLGAAAPAPAAPALLVVLPALAFVLAGLSLRRRPGLAAGLAIAVTAWSLVASARLFLTVRLLNGELVASYTWVAAGGVRLEAGFAVNPLTAAMLLVVAAVSLLVQVYSTAYLAGDPGYSRYFAYLSFFTAAMFGLVLSPNLFQLYVFYELVGLASFLLIGFWHEEPGPVAAARKAFVTTRLGDFGLLLGILLLYWHARTLDFTRLAWLAPELDPAVLRLVALLIFAGAAGKSAQFPLHVWLPDAMAGPTPVSALIHAATMVAAGVFLVARAFPLFAPAVAGRLPLLVVAAAGAVTSFLGATAATAQDDVKRVLAYSTVSQLGLMMLGLGAQSSTAAVFHLITHAFFKSLLFLGAGAAIRRCHHEQDIWRMGGLARPMPLTALAFAVGGLSLAGVPPLSGFYSKDAILLAVLEQARGSRPHAAFLTVGLAVSALTAFYLARLFFLIFTGAPQEEGPVSPGRAHRPGPAPREAAAAPPAMTVPLLLLAVPAAVLGYFGQRLLPVKEHLNQTLAGGTTALALAGIGAAWLLYGRRRPARDPLVAALGPVHRLLRSGYYLDDLYTRLGNYLVRGLAATLHRFDRTAVDGLVNGVAGVVLLSGRTLRRVQGGWVQRYLLYLVAAVFLALAAWLWHGLELYPAGGMGRW